jgi:hypothetical protein
LNQLPGDSAGAVAIADGTFAHVWDNVSVDPNFGITAPIYLDQFTPAGAPVDSIAVPDGTVGASSRGRDLLMGSFSSKSELALNRSTGGSAVSFMGYVAPANTLDASNGNTPGVFDPTNPDGQSVYRGVAELDTNGKFRFTETNAYSGDNGRAATRRGYGPLLHGRQLQQRRRHVCAGPHLRDRCPARHVGERARADAETRWPDPGRRLQHHAAAR